MRDHGAVAGHLAVGKLGVVRSVGPDAAAEAGDGPHAVRVGGAAPGGLGAEGGEGKAAGGEGNRRARIGRGRRGRGEVGRLGEHEVAAVHTLLLQLSVDPGRGEAEAIFVGVLEEIIGDPVLADQGSGVLVIVIVNGAVRDEGCVRRRGGVAGVVFAGGQQAVVRLGEDVDALLPEDLGGDGAGEEVVVTVAHVAAGLAHLAGGEDIRQAGAGVVAEDIHDVVEHRGVVAEDGDGRAGDQVERAFVRGPGDLVGGGGGGPEDVAEVVLNRDRVLLGPARPGAAQDAGAAAIGQCVVTEVEA